MNLTLSPEVEEAEAVRSLIAEIADGETFPIKGGRGCVTAGMFLQERLDEDDIEALLCAVLARNLDGWEARLRALCSQGLGDWLRENRPDMVAERIEELRRENPNEECP